MHVIGRTLRERAARSRSDDGAIAILVALLSVVLFGFGALVVDIGHAQQVRSQAQSAVDAASLAGVQVLATPGKTPSDVADTVKDYVSKNMGIGTTDWAGCTDPAPLTLPADTDHTDTCISTLTSGVRGVTSFQVRVKLPVQHVPATFGGLFGVSSIAVSPIAQAMSGQPLPPECGPCLPALDETTGQPKPETPAPTFPLRSELPAAVPPAGPLDPLGSGCPTTPGLFTAAAFPSGVRIAAGFRCDLKPGLYVFDDTTLYVLGTLFNHLAGLNDPSGVPDGTGVTLVFYGTGTLTVEGRIGLVDDNGVSSPLKASRADVVWQQGQPIPGVAIVLDQCEECAVETRTFELGNNFDINGSIYALDGHTTWVTQAGDCPAVGSTCWVHDEGADSLIATTTTAFGGSPLRIPTVGTDHPMAEPPPSPPHLVK